jgi:uncharacterized membrane protein YhhN
MRDVTLAVLAVAFVISGLVALIARDRAEPIPGGSRGGLRLWCAFKPFTTALLFLVVGPPDTSLQRAVAAGLLFSLAGDVALLGKPRWHGLGLLAFLAAHVWYIAAFVPLAALSWGAGLAALAAAAVSAWIVKSTWRGARAQNPVLPFAVLVYSLALTAMVVSAAATIGGPLALSHLAALGAGCFYVGDATIAFGLGGMKIRRAWWLTSGVYWIGQFLIAWAARAGT